MTRKEIANEFLRLAATGNVQEAYDKYVHKDFFIITRISPVTASLF